MAFSAPATRSPSGITHPVSPAALRAPDALAPAKRARLPRLRQLLRHEWILTIGLLSADITAWLALYGSASLIRDAFFVSPLQFVVIELLQLGTLIGGLAVIGGYNRHTDMRSLQYTTEHVLAISSAAAISAVLIYAAAAYDQSMRPSRAAFLMSFALFLIL